MMPDNNVRLFAIIAPLLVYVGALYIIGRQKSGRHATVSKQAAEHPVALVILAFILLVGGTMYYNLLWYYIKPRYDIPLFELLFVVALVCTIPLALVPAHANKQFLARIHTASGLVIVGIMYVFVWLFATSGKVIGFWANASMWAFLAFTTLVCMLLPLTSRTLQYVLYIEIVFAVLFNVFIACITYA